MIDQMKNNYTPNEYESEKASNSYLMSLVAVIVGLPLPIINLLATFIFYIGNRKSTYYVRWHCTQVLLSQLSMFFANSFCFWWTVRIIWGSALISNEYISYLFTIIIFNIAEFAATIYAAIQTRKGKHVEWLFYANLTHLFCKPR
jgi:hypothetical protein